MQLNDKCCHYICYQEADIGVSDIFKVLAHFFHNKAKDVFKKEFLHLELFTSVKGYSFDAQIYYQARFLKLIAANPNSVTSYVTCKDIYAPGEHS